MLKATLAILLIISAVAIAPDGHATTVRHVYEWEYAREGELHILRYVHEIWDAESSGFTISCGDDANKTFLQVDYDMFDDNYFNSYKKSRIQPRMEIKSRVGRITVLGELNETDMYPSFVFKILQFESNDLTKILLSKDAKIVFPNKTFRIWNIKKSDTIAKFLSACTPDKRSRPR
jgi:hypothetical protein